MTRVDPSPSRLGSSSALAVLGIALTVLEAPVRGEGVTTLDVATVSWQQCCAGVNTSVCTTNILKLDGIPQTCSFAKDRKCKFVKPGPAPVFNAFVSAATCVDGNGRQLRTASGQAYCYFSCASSSQAAGLSPGRRTNDP